MAAPTVQLSIDIGSHTQYTLVYTDSTGTARVDLAGYTARSQVRDNAGNLLLDLSTPSGGLTIGSVSYGGSTVGVIQVTFAATATRNLSASQGWGDLEIYPGGSASLATRLLNWDITFVRNATQEPLS